MALIIFWTTISYRGDEMKQEFEAEFPETRDKDRIKSKPFYNY